MAEAQDVSIAPSILLVDDDERFRLVLARAFRSRGYDTRVAGSYDEAMVSARADSPEMAVIDLRMPGRSGLQLVQALKEIDPTTTIVMLTGFGTAAMAVEAIALGASTFLRKPADADDVLAAFGASNAAAVPGRSDSVETDWKRIDQTVSICGGDLMKASALVGVHRRRLRRWLTERGAS